VSRQVGLQAVNRYAWSTRALAWGYDTTTGDHVAFAVSLERAGMLARLLETEEAPVVSVPDVDVLFVRRDHEDHDRPPGDGPG